MNLSALLSLPYIIILSRHNVYVSVISYQSVTGTTFYTFWVINYKHFTIDLHKMFCIIQNTYDDFGPSLNNYVFTWTAIYVNQSKNYFILSKFSYFLSFCLFFYSSVSLCFFKRKMYQSYLKKVHLYIHILPCFGLKYADAGLFDAVKRKCFINRKMFYVYTNEDKSFLSFLAQSFLAKIVSHPFCQR